MVIRTSGSSSLGPRSTWASSSSRMRTVIWDSGFRNWYWTMVSALRNLGHSSSSSARSWKSFPM